MADTKDEMSSVSPTPPSKPDNMFAILSSQNSLLSSQGSRAQSTPVLTPSPSKYRPNKKAPSLRRPQAVVKLIIGPDSEQATFYVHKDMICHHSSFFATAFNDSRYVESDTQTLYLSDVSIDDFGVCVEWIYDQHIELDPLDPDPKIMIFARLWNLAQRFKIAKLQNKLMDKLRALVEEAEKDVLRRLAADRMAWGTTQQGMGAWIKGGHLPVEMLEDIVLALKRDHVPGKPTVRLHFGDASEYYVDLAEERRGNTEEK